MTELLLIVTLILIYIFIRALILDTLALMRAPRGRKIEAYYSSIKGKPIFGDESIMDYVSRKRGGER